MDNARPKHQDKGASLQGASLGGGSPVPKWTSRERSIDVFLCVWPKRLQVSVRAAHRSLPCLLKPHLQ